MEPVRRVLHNKVGPHAVMLAASAHLCMSILTCLLPKQSVRSVCQGSEHWALAL